MQDSSPEFYQSAATKKMTDYAHHMRTLLEEAYVDGILLSVGYPEEHERGDLEPASADERRQALYVSVPIEGHLHPKLPKAVGVMANAIVKVDSGDILAATPIPKSPAPLPIIPRYTDLSARFFVSPEDLKPWAIPDSGHLTSAFKFGEAFDILGLTNYDDLRQRGQVDETDVIDPWITLDAIFFRTADGVVRKLYVNNLATNAAVAAIQGNFAEMAMDFRAHVTSEGSLATSSLTNNIKLHVVGKINLQFGTIKLDASGDGKVDMLGYTLNIARFNPNRRPVPQASEIRKRSKSG